MLTKLRRLRFQCRPVRRGTVTYMVAVVIPIFMIFGGFLINLTYLELVRTDLRIATDAAARAAAHTWATTASRDLSVEAAQDAAVRNTVAGKALTLTEDQIEFGRTSRPDGIRRYQFDLRQSPWNAVRINGSRAATSTDGPVALVFPAPMGRRHFEPVVTTVCTQMERSIVLVVDRSSSMNNLLSTDPNEGTRWDLVKYGVAEIVGMLNTSPSHERLGLITYSRQPRCEQSVSDGCEQIVTAIQSLQPDTGDTMGHTASAIRLGSEMLSVARAEQPLAATIMLVITDGDEYAESQLQESVREAVEAGVIVLAATIDRDANKSAARMVARYGLGQHFHADSRAELRAALQSIVVMTPTILAE